MVGQVGHVAAAGEAAQVPDPQAPIVAAAGQHVGGAAVPADHVDVGLVGLHRDHRLRLQVEEGGTGGGGRGR